MEELKTLKDFEKTYTFPTFKIIPPQKFKSLPKKDLIELENGMKRHLEYWCMKTSKNIHKDLKEEAIKWIKSLENNEEDYGLKPESPPTKIIFCNSIEISPKPAIIYWIKHFFNITEDDLK